MGPGPVFHIELITGARRPRMFLLRVVYVLILLFVVWMQYESLRRTYGFAPLLNSSAGGAFSGVQISYAGLGSFAYQTFNSIVIVQAFAVVFLTPALVAGVIADERRRKTLHYLLASQLSSGEIVLGKLLARLLNVAVFIAMGLPVLSLLTLLGGVDPRLVALSAVGSLSIAYFIGGISILISTSAKSAREAIFLTYLLAGVLLVFPTVMEGLSSTLSWPWKEIYPWLRPANEWIRAISPISLLIFARISPSQFLVHVAWMIGLQVAIGSLFVLAAVLRLRPAFCGDRGPNRRAAMIKSLGRARRFTPRPECGEDAMLWKERYIARTGGFAKLAALIVAIGAIALVIGTSYELVRDAAVEHYFGHSDLWDARKSLNLYLRILTGLSTAAWLLAVASSASASITTEREGDSWISLTSTPLDRHEILRAKLVGSIWGILPMMSLLLGFWGIGILVGGLHPFGALAAFLELCIFTSFAASLGLYFSLISTTSARALVATVATMVVLNGAYMFCCIPLRADSMVISAGCGPFLVPTSLFNIKEFENFWREDRGMQRQVNEMIFANVAGSIWYAAGAALMLGLCYARFDEKVDRPRRF